MPTIPLEADYLVIGSGAMGMAFTDALIGESNASVIMVDRHARPGGHWNDAYRFVRLHTASVFYGVSSRPLGRDAIDEVGPNRGFYENATGAEVAGYFDQVMQQGLLPSGRVRYFPSCDYRGDRRFVSLLSGAEYEVNVKRAVVDATYTNTQLPSTRKPPFGVAEGMRCLPLHELVNVAEKPSKYVVLGAGKTGIDACLWLLERGVAPADIRWIRPRDPWLLNRAHVQPGKLLRGTYEGLALQMEAARAAGSVDDLLVRLGAARHLLRIDESVTPTMYRCATVSEAEIAELRRIEQVVRLGRVQHIERDRLVLERGTVPTDASCLHVDCTASGIARRPKLPVFGEQRITLQAVRACQPSFSAALIGHVEASYANREEKNALCTAVPYPEAPLDWLKVTLAGSLNEQQWRKDKALRAWIDSCRLNGTLGVDRSERADEAALQLQQRFRDNVGPALLNLKRLLEQAGAASE